MSKKQMPILCFTLLLYLVLVYLPMSSIIPITHLFFLIPSSKHLNSQGPIHECLEKNLYYTDISSTSTHLCSGYLFYQAICEKTLVNTYPNMLLPILRLALLFLADLEVKNWNRNPDTRRKGFIHR